MSLTAAGLISNLYLATLLQIFQDFLKRQVRLQGAFLECRQIIRIFSQTQLYGLIHQIGKDWSVSAAFSRKARCRSGSK